MRVGKLDLSHNEANMMRKSRESITIWVELTNTAKCKSRYNKAV